MPLDHELITDLEKLRTFLNKLTSELNSSGVERTAHFLNYVGTDCAYFKKSIEFFLEEDYDKLRDTIRDLADLFDILEGKGIHDRS